MTKAGINKLEAAQRHLDCAIRLRFAGEDSLAFHSLAYIAYRLLRELLNRDAEKVMINLEKSLKLGNVPNFSKHRQGDPDAVLEEHSPETAHLTIELAIMLWKEHGRQETSLMQDFLVKVPNPYKPGYRHDTALNAARTGMIGAKELRDTITASSTDGSVRTEVKKPGE